MSMPIIRCFGRRALVSSSRGAITCAPNSTRALGATRHLSLTQLVDKNAAPPKALNPPPKKEQTRVVNQRPNNRKKFQAPKQQKQPEKKKEKISGLPTSSWVIIRNIPPMSTLTDILFSIDEVMAAQAEGGIVDLDAVWKGGGQVSMLERDPSDDWVRSAHIVLSSHGRPNAWRIEFCNRSLAHAFLEYCRANRFHCSWKPVLVEAWELREGNKNTDALEISDSMIRVENGGDGMTVDHVRHLFRRYDLTREGPSVRVFNESSSHKLFLVHFADPSWARAAVRELQGVRVHHNFLRLAQYPKQLVASDNC